MKIDMNRRTSGSRLGRRLVTIVATGLAFIGTSVPAWAQPAMTTPFSYGVTTSYTYRTDGVYSGLLSTTKTLPDVLASCTLKTVDYDSYGNVSSTRLENCPGAPASAAFTTRTTTARFDAVPMQAITVGGASTPVSIPAGLFPTTSTNAASQATTTQFDPRFGAPLKQVDINSQSSYQAVDDFGRVVSQKLSDSTSVVTRYCILASTGLDTSSNSPGCAMPATSEAPANAFMFTEKQPLDATGHVMGAWTRTYSDRLGRDIRVVTQGYDGPSQGALSGGLVVADKVYGVVGQILLESNPHFLSNGSTSTTGSNDVRVTSYDYDAMGRAVRVAVSDPAGHGGSVDFSRNGPTGYGVLTAAVSRVDYVGLQTTLTNDKVQTRVEERDPFKQLVRVTDANGGQLSTLYDAFGHVVQTQDALSNVTSYTFDAKGDLLQQNDPDKGVTNLTYDALGQAITSQNANEVAWGTSTKLTYDVMGRVTARTAFDYNSTWTYDTCANGVGLLCSASSTNQVNKSYTYDALGRLSVKRLWSPTLSLPESVAYDATTGRLSMRTYPTGLQVKVDYTALGYASDLKLVTPASVTPLPHTVGGPAGTAGSLAANSLLWSNDVVNAAGASERQSYGNGVATTTGYEPFSGRLATRSATGSKGLVTSQAYHWDSLNDLLSRSESAPGPNALSETFSYGDAAHGDNLQRLSAYTVADPDMPGMSRTVALGYNALGELLFKSDVGNYSYGGAHPHALKTVAGASNDSFSYDARGNVTGGGNGRFSTIKYTSFDLPDATQGVTGNSTQPRYTWLYDEGHARVTETRKVLSSDGVHDDVRTTWYDHPDNAGGLGFEYEIDQPASANALMRNVVENRHFLSVGGRAIGVLVSEGALNATATTPPAIASISLTKVEYWSLDHLGSLVATTDHTGTVTARYSYDPFGKRRATSGAYDANGAIIGDWSTVVDNGTARGFTGHEHLDDIGLIQMNGRIFEPTLAVFLQGDPTVPHADDLQSYHRYSYCLNNPMGCTDPTGFQDVQKVEIIGSPAPQVPTAPQVAGNGGLTGASVSTRAGGGYSRVKDSVTYVGSFITQHPQQQAQQAAQDALAAAGAAAVIARGVVLFPGGGAPVPVSEVMARLGVSTVQDMLDVLKIGKEALVWVTMNPEGRVLSVTFMVSFTGMSYLDNYLHISNWVADAAFTYDWRYWAVAAMLNAPPPGKSAGQGADTKGTPDGPDGDEENKRGVGGKGWRGDKNWRNAVNQVSKGGTHEEINGTVPTREEGTSLLRDAGARIDRIEGPHEAPNPHDYPHINYTTEAGVRGTIRITGL